jgi:uncharacterized protein YqgC (DUF456 family)
MTVDLLGQGLVLFVTLFVMMIGLIFTVIPPLPGTVIIWAAAVGYGLILGWEKLGWPAFGLLTFLMLVGIIADTLGGQFGAKFGGASCLSILVGTVLGFGLGILASLVATPVVGCLVGVGGVLGGILLVERIRHRNWSTAVDATKGYVAGTAAGIAAKVTTGLLMFVIFLVRVYIGP